MSLHAALQLQTRACRWGGSGDYLHDRDWRQQFKGSAIKKKLSGYLPQVPTSRVSERARHANAPLQLEEYTGVGEGGAVQRLLSVNLPSEPVVKTAACSTDRVKGAVRSFH